MTFNEMQIMFGNDLSADNLKKQEYLYKNTSAIREEILPAFNFDEFKKDDNPIEYALALVFNKIYVMLVSMENVILLNDGWLAMYLYRYAYELFIKTKYLLDKNSQEDNKIRVEKFLEVGQWDKIKEKLDAIESDDEFIQEIKNNHKDSYKIMNAIVHPNIESLSFHIRHEKNNDRFLFMASTVKLNLLIISKIIETIINRKNELKFTQYPDIKKIQKLINDLNK
jgi:hypothetical protein